MQVGRLTSRGANPIVIRICDAKGKPCRGRVTMYAGQGVTSGNTEYPGGAITWSIRKTGLLCAEVVCHERTIEAIFCLDNSAETTSEILQKIQVQKEGSHAGFTVFC